MTSDYIAFHAVQRPDAIALLYGRERFTYATLDRAVRAVMRSLSELGLGSVSRAVIAVNDTYVHLLLLLAFERLGVATASYQPIDDISLRQMPEFFDVIVTESESPLPAGKPHLAVTKQWLGRAMAAADNAWTMPPRPPDDIPARFLRTSGTTGPVKWLQISRRVHEGMINERIRNFAMNPQSRQLFTLTFRVRAIFEFVSACLRAGGTLVCDEPARWPELMSSAGITHAIFFPIVLARVLEELPPNYAKPANLTVLCFGAHLSPSLRERATARLATGVCDIYGTIEVGSVCESWGGNDGFGTLLPRVRAEALDEEGASVPPGTPGRIRVRTPFMPDGYLGAPAMTERGFRDGWFYPNDVGILDGRGRLRILGRADDLLNIGGRKYLPTLLEELIRAEVPVDDVGVTSLPSEGGIERLWIGFTAARCDEAEVAERIAQALGRRGVEAPEVKMLEGIPRNANGKIQRDLLRIALAATAGRTA